MDVIISKREVRGYIIRRPKQILTYADAIIIIIRTKQVMIDTFIKLCIYVSEYGLLT
jgi:hypothetical protein